MNLAEKWVEYYLYGEEKYRGAADDLSELVITDPKKAWEIINRINEIEIQDKAWEDHVNSVLGCGPIEGLLALHPQEFTSLILNEARNSQRLCEQLSVIYESSIDKDIWLKIQKVIEKKSAK